MPFDHAAFVSYTRPNYMMMKRLYEVLMREIEEYCEVYLREDIFIDSEQLEPGENFNRRIALALCRSVCLILLYTPSYFHKAHDYCAKEYVAMKGLEKIRINKVAPHIDENIEMIIPIVIRGFDSLPSDIKSNRNVIDFSSYDLRNPELASNPQYKDEIEKIAKRILSIYEFFSAHDIDPCDDCAEFELPGHDELVELFEQIKNEKIERVQKQFPKLKVPNDF